MELIFDQGFGDLFVVRVAGDIVAPSIVGSIELAASQFGTRLVVVMGHTGCGAVTATCGRRRRGAGRIAFGPEADFVRHAGLFVATVPLDCEVADRREVTTLNAPGRSLTIHPSRDRPIAALIFWAERGGAELRDLEAARAHIRARYQGDGWLVPAVLRCLDHGELWFDAVSQVQIDRWSRGRVVLLGDAASCVSLFGGGSSLAIEGAHALSQALAAHPIDLAGALAAYEHAHRPRVVAAMRGMRRMASMLVPRTRLGMRFRNAVLAVVALAAAVSRRRHRS